MHGLRPVSARADVRAFAVAALHVDGWRPAGLAADGERFRRQVAMRGPAHT